MRKIVLFIIFMLSILWLQCLSFSDIQGNDDYFFGTVSETEGYDDYDEAREKSLARLSENISIMVSSDFESYVAETNGANDESVKSIVKTYSGITLKNLKPIQNRGYNGWNITYYLHKDSLDVIYNERKKLIISLYETGLKSEGELNLSYALQNYYYSLILMGSIPYAVIDFENENLRVAANTRITSILTGLQFIYEKDNRPQEDVRDILLRVEYNDMPVEMIDFSYIERDYVVKTEGRGGRATCRLTGGCTSYSKLNIEVQYKFSSNKTQVKEVDALWQAVKKPSFDAFRQTIELMQTTETKQKIVKYQIETEPEYESVDQKLDVIEAAVCPVEKEIAEEVFSFLDGIRNGDINENYRGDRFLSNKLRDMSQYNNVELIDDEYEININKTYEGWEVRSLPVYCSYPSLRRQSTEFLVLDFDNNGNLQDVNFCLFAGLFDTYAGKFKDTDTYEKRQILVKFLEKYRSAYLNRDISTLEKVFSDDAVIIVGRKMKLGEAVREINTTMMGSQPDIEYLTMTKDEFLNRQRSIFIAQEDIQLGFNSCKVRQNNDDNDLFGISMRQEYSSTGYSDEGFLFLLIDFKGKDPMIYVRSWQPAEWDETALVNMTNFTVRK